MPRPRLPQFLMATRPWIPLSEARDRVIAAAQMREDEGERAAFTVAVLERLVTAFQDLEIAVHGSYAIENVPRHYDPAVQTIFWNAAREQDVDWERGECRYTVLCGEAGEICKVSSACGLEVDRKALERFIDDLRKAVVMARAQPHPDGSGASRRQRPIDDVYRERVEAFRQEHGCTPTAEEDRQWFHDGGYPRETMRLLRKRCLTDDEKKGGRRRRGEAT